MKKVKMMCAIAIVAFGLTACTRVEPGHVGVKVNYMGSDRGVQDLPIVTGFVPYMPGVSKVFEWPTFTQTYSYTHDTKEGSLTNEEFTFNDRDGMAMQCDLSVSYNINPADVAKFYVKFRSDDLLSFTRSYLKNVIREGISSESVNYSAEEILGKKKEELRLKVMKRVIEEVRPYGVVITQMGFVGAIRSPIANAMAKKAEAQANAITAMNKVEQVKAEAAQKIAEAEGEAKSNQIRASSITSNLLEWERMKLQRDAIAKWNGNMPSVMSSGTMLYNIPVK